MKFTNLMIALTLFSSGLTQIAKAQNKVNHHQIHLPKQKFQKNQPHEIIVEKTWARASIGKTGVVLMGMC